MSTTSKTDRVVLMLYVATLAIGSLAAGIVIWDYTDSGFTNRDQAVLETVIVAKEAAYLGSDEVTYRYFTWTDAKDTECEYSAGEFGVKVNGKLHECPGPTEVKVTEAEWNDLQVGLVLKRVELK